MNMPPTPELDRQAAVLDDSHKIGEFLDWLTAQDIHLAVYETTRECTYFDRYDRQFRCKGGRLIGLLGSDFSGVDRGGCPRCDGTGVVLLDDPPLVPRREPFNQLLARFYGIDLNRAEEERRAVLDHLAGGG